MEPWIRILISRDIPDVLRIENESFDQPWSSTFFEKYRKRRGNICLAAEYQEIIIGYAFCEIYKNSIHIDNIAVDEHFRRQKVGSKLVERMASKLNQQRSCVTADVRETNLAAQLFLRSTGFKAVKINRQFYDNDEDSYAFVLRRTQFLDKVSTC